MACLLNVGEALVPRFFPGATPPARGTQAPPTLTSNADRAAALQQLFEDSHPISKEDLFDLIVTESALDQFPREIPSVRMVRQAGNEVRPG